jgi:hypothetical protein
MPNALALVQSWIDDPATILTAQLSRFHRIPMYIVVVSSAPPKAEPA